MAHCAMALTVSGFHTAPVGLFGVFAMMAFVCSVRAASMASMLGSKLRSAPANTVTGTPPASFTASG